MPYYHLTYFYLCGDCPKSGRRLMNGWAYAIHRWRHRRNAGKKGVEG